MAKIALTFSPFFFGLLFLVLIAFISQQGGGVSGQSCAPGGNNIFAGKLTAYGCYGYCEGFCKSTAIPIGYTKPNLGVKSWSCSFVGPTYYSTPWLCVCCVD
ncbi:hypothetical protein C5167_047639 [Papaver somniferum]|uniref:Knottin scorpion toxin-like domain-containing protein n=1 Tax=Papaver somniferum TaxID=3469 RepID=A0A4Y7LHY3_PAPSO|nr:hypothetical protein C5167_047639 [Papaver somniferum]